MRMVAIYWIWVVVFGAKSHTNIHLSDVVVVVVEHKLMAPTGTITFNAFELCWKCFLFLLFSYKCISYCILIGFELCYIESVLYVRVYMCSNCDPPVLLLLLLVQFRLFFLLLFSLLRQCGSVKSLCTIHFQFVENGALCFAFRISQFYKECKYESVAWEYNCVCMHVSVHAFGGCLGRQ